MNELSVLDLGKMNICVRSETCELNIRIKMATQTYEYLRDRISFSLRFLDVGTDLCEVLLSKACSCILSGTGENGYGEGMGFVDGSLYA